MKALGMLGIAVLALVALSLSACAPTQALTQTPDRYLIVPGRSIGPFLLGITIAEFEAKLGPPTAVHQLRFDWGEPLAHVWMREDIAIFVFSYTDPARRGRVYEIMLPAVPQNPALTARNTRYRTAEGLGIGSHRTEIHRAYGAPWFHSAHSEYFRNGLAFTFWREGPDPDRATQVGVFRPIAP